MYEDESYKLFIGREFTLEQFRPWFAAQSLGTQPYNAVGVHHAYIPDETQYRGVQTVLNVFNYYRDARGWPEGVGPHLWVAVTDAGLRIVVGTHPRHDGIGISYRNRRWLHIETLWNGDRSPWSQAMLDGLAEVCNIVSDGGRIPKKLIKVGMDNPSSPIGFMNHRDVDPANPPKSCPGRQNTDEIVRSAVERPLTPATKVTQQGLYGPVMTLGRTWAQMKAAGYVLIQGKWHVRCTDAKQGTRFGPIMAGSRTWSEMKAAGYVLLQGQWWKVC